MNRKRSRSVRISDELAKELDMFAKKNDMQITDASREVAKELKKMKNKKVRREIEF